MGWLSKLLGREIVRDEAGDIGEDAGEPAREPQTGRPRRTLPGFRGTAADHMRHGARAGDRTRIRLRKAFTPSRPVMDTAMYAGRTDLLVSLIRSIEDQYLHVVIFGPRGIGKTSTLHVLSEIASEARYIVRYVSCGERSEFDDVFRALLGEIPLLFHEAYDPTSDAIEEGLTFRDLVTDAPLTVSVVSDLLSKVSGTRLLAILDEFDRARSADFKRSVAELIKNLSDRGSRVQLIVAGVAQNLNELIEHIPSIRRNVLGLQIPNMTAAEIGELIANGEAAGGIAFEPPARQLITELALGLPYLAMLISQHSGLAALDRDAQTVGREDVERAIDQVIEHLSLRIAPEELHQIEAVLAAGMEREFGLMSGIALRNAMRLPLAKVKAELALNGDARAHLDGIVDRFKLLRPTADDPEGSYAFHDDGVPLYLWVRLMRSNSHLLLKSKH